MPQMLDIGEPGKAQRSASHASHHMHHITSHASHHMHHASASASRTIFMSSKQSSMNPMLRSRSRSRSMSRGMSIILRPPPPLRLSRSRLRRRQRHIFFIPRPMNFLPPRPRPLGRATAVAPGSRIGKAESLSSEKRMLLWTRPTTALPTTALLPLYCTRQSHFLSAWKLSINLLGAKL